MCACVSMCMFESECLCFLTTSAFCLCSSLVHFFFPPLLRPSPSPPACPDPMPPPSAARATVDTSVTLSLTAHHLGARRVSPWSSASRGSQPHRLPTQQADVRAHGDSCLTHLGSSRCRSCRPSSLPGSARRCLRPPSRAPHRGHTLGGFRVQGLETYLVR